MPNTLLQRIEQKLTAALGDSGFRLRTLTQQPTYAGHLAELWYAGSPLFTFKLRQDNDFSTIFFQGQAVRHGFGEAQEDVLVSLLTRLGQRAVGQIQSGQWHPVRVTTWVEEQMGYIGGSYLDPLGGQTPAMRARVGSETILPKPFNLENLEANRQDYVRLVNGVPRHAYARGEGRELGPLVEDVFMAAQGGAGRWNPQTGQIELLGFKKQGEYGQTVKHIQKSGLQDFGTWTDPRPGLPVSPVRESWFFRRGVGSTDAMGNYQPGEVLPAERGQVVRVALTSGMQEGEIGLLRQWDISQQRLIELRGPR